MYLNNCLNSLPSKYFYGQSYSRIDWPLHGSIPLPSTHFDPFSVLVFSNPYAWETIRRSQNLCTLSRVVNFWNHEYREFATWTPFIPLKLSGDWGGRGLWTEKLTHSVVAGPWACASQPRIRTDPCLPLSYLFMLGQVETFSCRILYFSPWKYLILINIQSSIAKI